MITGSSLCAHIISALNIEEKKDVAEVVLKFFDNPNEIKAKSKFYT